MTARQPISRAILHDQPGAAPDAGTGGRILAPGRNCRVVARASRAAALVDAAAYFARLEQAFRLARRSITIVGWDFDARIVLCPEAGEGRAKPLSKLFLELVEAHPELEIRILVWDFSVFYAPGEALPMLLGAPWQEHPRIHLRLDDRHPLRGAHHQKLVCVDDALAFVGGMDLTIRRWDTERHEAEDPRRVDPDGCVYAPVHDLQMVVDGDAARAVAQVVRDRWRIATGEDLPPVAAGSDPWPPGLPADFTDVSVAVARTIPARSADPGVREAAALTLDALAAARHRIYIEAQYLTAAYVGDLLAERLAEPDGPEIVALVTCNSDGLIERFLMGSNRDRLIRRLKQADRFDRLRVYFPVAPAGEGFREILIHSKLIIVDDDFVRIGSSNLNNRSVGLDTECDIAIEAMGDDDRRAIAGLRDRLLAEHLGTGPEAVARALAEEGSLVRAVEKLNHNPRRLKPFPAAGQEGPVTFVPGTGLLDPENPFEPLRLFQGGDWDI
jgi:phosphatidylserine/phosphatidylglycerophosphate/cardiolipin synthase-like enzyme